jgi:hypothetical protein
MVLRSFGFGLVITASMTESLLAAADDSNKAPYLSVKHRKGVSRQMTVLGWSRRVSATAKAKFSRNILDKTASEIR